MSSDAYLLKRTGVAKMIGVIIGLIAFFMIPRVLPTASMWLRVGVLMWYPTFGVCIGLFGLMDHHPWLKFRMPFWFRGLFFGASLNLVLVFLMHDMLLEMLTHRTGFLENIDNPFVLVAAGAVFGLLIDGITTRYAGEGLPGSERAGG